MTTRRSDCDGRNGAIHVTSPPTDLEASDREDDLADAAVPRRSRIRRVAHYFGRDVRKRRRPLISGTGFAILLGAARVAEPWPLKVVFDQVLFHRPAKGALTEVFLVFGPRPTDILAAAAVVLMATGFVHGFAYYMQDYMLASAAQDIVYAIRTRLYRHLHHLGLSFHLTHRVGDTLVRLSTDIVMLRDVLIDSIVTIFSGFVMLVLMLVVMTLVDPVLTLIVLATLPTVFVISYLYGAQIRVRSRKQRKREGEVASLMHESLAAMAVVQLNTAEERENERFRSANKRSLRQGVRTIRLEARMNRAVEIALAGGTVIVLWLGTTRVIHGHLSPGELVVFISYLRAAYRPLRRASKSVQRSAKALAAAERVIDILAIEPAIRDAPGAQPAAPFARELRLEGVSFAYVEGRDVLQGIDLTVPAGHSIALVGSTGSGKSTLLSLLPRLYDPREGRVSLDGADLRSLTVRSVRDQFAVVQQEAVLMGLSLAENIRYGAPNATDQTVRSAAIAAGLEPVLERLPDGLSTVVSERGASLSGGERQRVTIARAIARGAPILLLDEPTTGLDPRTRRQLADTLLALARGRTTVLITHDLELAARMDEAIVLSEGRIVARGRFEDLMRDSPDLRRLAGELTMEQA